MPETAAFPTKFSDTSPFPPYLVTEICSALRSPYPADLRCHGTFATNITVESISNMVRVWKRRGGERVSSARRRLPPMRPMFPAALERRVTEFRTWLTKTKHPPSSWFDDNHFFKHGESGAADRLANSILKGSRSPAEFGNSG